MSSRIIRNVLASAGVTALLLFGFTRDARADKPTPLAEKMGVYIHMINAWSNPLSDSRRDYFEVVDPKLGVTCKEGRIGSLQTAPFGYADMTLKDLPKFRTALKKAPKLDSDVAATNMVDAMAQILAVDDRQIHYFSGAKFQGDDCKRGKEIQATLFAAWPKFFESEKAVRAVVEKYSADQSLLKLSEAEKKYGKNSFHFYQRKILIDAKALVDASDALDRSKPADPAPLREKAAILKKDFDEVSPLYSKFSARDDAGDTGMWPYLLSYTNDFLQQAEVVAHQLDDGQKKKTPNPYAAAEHTRLIESYNKLIDASNQAVFSKNMK